MVVGGDGGGGWGGGLQCAFYVLCVHPSDVHILDVLHFR